MAQADAFLDPGSDALIICWSRWITNSWTVTTSIPENKRSKTSDIDLDRDDLPMEQALGLYWCVETDTFQFRTSVEAACPYTKCGILSVISSIYDLLGFVSPFILPLKLLLQMCRRNISRDEGIPQSFSCLWQEWTADLRSEEGV